MNPTTDSNELRRRVDRLLRRLGLLPPEPEVVIARVRPRPNPWAPRR